MLYALHTLYVEFSGEIQTADGIISDNTNINSFVLSDLQLCFVPLWQTVRPALSERNKHH